MVKTPKIHSPQQGYFHLDRDRCGERYYTILDIYIFPLWTTHMTLTSHSDFIGVNGISRGSSSSSSTFEPSSTFIPMTWFSTQEDVAYVSLHEPGSTFGESIQFCKINIQFSIMTVLSYCTKKNISLGLEVLTALMLKVHVLWDVKPVVTGKQLLTCYRTFPQPSWE